MTNEYENIFADTAPAPLDLMEAPTPGRRKDDPVLAMVRLTYRGLIRLDEKVTAHMQHTRDAMGEMMDDVVSRGFPDGDAEGHRRYHEAFIKSEEDKARFWHEMRIAAAKWLGLGLLGLVAGWAWYGFVHSITFPGPAK